MNRLLKDCLFLMFWWVALGGFMLGIFFAVQLSLIVLCGLTLIIISVLLWVEDE
jgi:hypothetical protein